MSPFQRLLGRAPLLRWCRMQYVLQVRASQAKARDLAVQTILSTLGNVIIGWAGVERILDELIAFYQHHGTNLEIEHPRSLSLKLKYLRAMQRDERFTPETREFLRSVRIQAKRLGDDRHDLIHGLLHQLNSDRWRTQRVVYDGPLARIQQKHYTAAEIQKISSEISEFGHCLSPKVWVIIRGHPSAFTASDLQQARRELGMS